jgi:uncharacterized protein (TIGR00369 family)
VGDPTEGVDPELLAAMAERFRETPLHKLLGIEIRPFSDDAPLSSVVDMPVTPNTFGSTGQVHGAAIALMFDVACASAATRASTYKPGENALVTADLHVRYVGRVRGTHLRAEATVVKGGRTLIVVDGRCLDDEDNLVATADFSATIVPWR